MHTHSVAHDSGWWDNRASPTERLRRAADHVATLLDAAQCGLRGCAAGALVRLVQFVRSDRAHEGGATALSHLLHYSLLPHYECQQPMKTRHNDGKTASDTMTENTAQSLALQGTPPPYSPWRMSVAPMMDWTDRHCRYFHRLLTRQTLLYTEMVNAGAIIHGGTERHLRFNAEEHPVALQLGGNEPDKLAEAARLGAQWGYDEINLNCGCPSDRVQRGAFGASLMKDPQLVADCVKAMKDVVDVPVTVKHRIGIDKVEDYGFVRDFVGTVADAGCTVFIVHARNAWLQGLSPKENRDIPPLRYEIVHRLKAEFPQFTIAINGGIQTDEVVHAQLEHLDGVMIGREVYHNPWWMARWDALYYSETGGAPCPLTREEVELAMVEYMEREAAQYGTPWPHIARHMLGLRHSLPGARIWRQVWSNHLLKDRPAREVHALAVQSYAQPSVAEAGTAH